MTRRAATVAARLATLLVTMLALVAPIEAHAAPPLVPAAGYGFGDGAQLSIIPVADVKRELDAVAKTSGTWLRVLIPWTLIEPTRGNFDWAQSDAIMAAAAAHNLKVLGVIAYSPDWARAPGTYYTAPPDDPNEYAKFAATVVRRYAGQVSNWQLWNEPNLALFFGQSTVDAAARYTALVKLAYPAIKAAQPASTVVLAGLSRLLGADGPPAFLSRMYDAGIKGYFDAGAAHPYLFPGPLAADVDHGWSDVGRIRDIMVAHGDGAKQIWMTEFGAPTSTDPDGVSPQDQAKVITDVLAAAAGTGYSGPAFIYSIRDTATPQRADREANFGALLTTDWQPKFTAGVLAR